MLTSSTTTTLGSRRLNRLAPNYEYPKGIMSPWQFAVVVLGLRLYKWQAEVLEALGQGLPVALCAANGSGKTQVVIASFILWFLYSFPRGICPVTSGSWTQLSEQLWPAVYNHKSKFSSWHWTKGRIQTPEGGRLILFSVIDPGRAEGYHGTEISELATSVANDEPPPPDWLGAGEEAVDEAIEEVDRGAPCAYIIDEAKTVGSGIFTACNRCTKQFQLFSSSPGEPAGEFYDCFHSLANFYYTKKVTFYECPHLKEDTRAMDEAKYGLDHPYYRSRYLAEFTDDEGPGVIISPSILAKCLASPPAHKPGRITAFCDFAGGTDENVLAVCDGNKVDLHSCWIEDDTMEACKQFVRLFIDLKRVYPSFTPDDIFGDNGGMGKSMIDRIHELGWHIHRVDFGIAAARNDNVYSNRGTEIWWETVKEIEKCQIIFPNDRTFFSQATTRRRLFDAKGRMIAEPKKEMFKRGLRSPDRADAVLGALWARRSGAITGLEDIAKFHFPSTRFAPMEDIGSFEADFDKWQFG